MARPKRVPRDESVEELIQLALIDLMCEAPLEQISVGQIAAKAGCSRSAFYYHYADVYDLFDRMVKSRLPVKEVGALFATSLFSSAPDGALPQIEADAIIAGAIGPHRREVQELYRILGGKESGLLIQRMKAEAVAVWSKIYEDKGLVLGPSDRTVLEFSLNGMLGAVAYRMSIGSETAMEDVIRLMAPELPRAISACLSKAQGLASL
ncbi:MAG: TetR/AcrR family transcriptional regulator [Eggerthellaceae bacterium]|nr:TetR/AcrR family transcriptional regulator [Eggerthellaceae bacterium]